MKALSTIVIVGLAATLLQACDGPSEHQFVPQTTTTDNTATATAAATPTMPASAAPATPGVMQLTKQQFQDAVVGKSMEQVKAALGPPQNVSDVGGGITAWYYWPEHVRVFDTDAGIVLPGSSSVRFDGPSHAVGVSFG